MSTPPLRRLLLHMICTWGSALAMVSSASAEITLDAGFTEAHLSPEKMWAVSRLYHRGRDVMTYNSSNGLVVQLISGEWSGEGHGQEVLETAVLFVDGVPTDIVDGTTYHGTIMTLRRAVVLGNTVRVRSTMTVSPDGLDETYALEQVGLRTNLIRIYAPASTRADRYTDIELRNGNTVVDSATVDRNDRAFYRPPVSLDANAVLQRDPIVGDGVITRWSGFPVALWIWDRPGDNKLYLAARDILYNDSNFGMSVSMRFCQDEGCAP